MSYIVSPEDIEFKEQVEACTFPIQDFDHRAHLRSNPRMLDSKIMMTHYSEDILFSDKARNEFVAPNLEPIPTLNGTQK